MTNGQTRSDGESLAIGSRQVAVREQERRHQDAAEDEGPSTRNPSPAEANRQQPGRRSSDNRPSSHDSLLNEFAYCVASFSAVFTPVSITMILSALVVVFVNTDETRAEGAATYANTYEAVDLEEGNSSQNFFASIINTFIIVTVIGLMTFVVVLLYKYRCMKVLVGYMVLVTTMLLGYYTAIIWRLAIMIYGWSIDTVTFGLVIYNFAAVGTLAIFYGKGIPLWVTQGYMIASSVILAWQLSFFGDWTAWTLLVMLALYDLFAVLAPCGPLKALVNQMSKPNAPTLPSLLYEAPLPQNVQRPTRNRTAATNTAENDTSPPSARTTGSTTTRQPAFFIPDSQVQTTPPISTPTPTPAPAPAPTPTPTPTAATNDRKSKPIINSSPTKERGDQYIEVSLPPNEAVTNSTASSTSQDSRNRPSQSERRNGSHASQTAPSAPSAPSTVPRVATTSSHEERRKTRIALALAKLYKLDVVDTDGSLQEQPRGFFHGRRNSSSKHSTRLVEPRAYRMEEVRSTEWTAKQLATEVQVDFSMRAGWIDRATREQQRPIDEEGEQYVVYRATGEISRMCLVNREGKVFNIRRNENGDDANGGKKDSNSIKLGLGDFIFYSILVSKAALHSFTTFSACMVVILAGLGGTLILLAVNGKALPALPISIFLGVIFYLLTRMLIEPWIHAVLMDPFYV